MSSFSLADLCDLADVTPRTVRYYIVQGLLRTTDGVSPVVSAGEVWTTLVLFGLIYLTLFIAWLRIFLGIIRKGPEDVVEMLESEKSAGQAAPAGAGR